MTCVPSKPSTILIPGCAYARIMKPVPAKCCGAAPVVARIGFGKPCAWPPPLYTTRKAIWATNTGAYAPDWERQKPLPPWRTNWPESFGLSFTRQIPFDQSLFAYHEKVNEQRRLKRLQASV